MIKKILLLFLFTLFFSCNPSVNNNSTNFFESISLLNFKSDSIKINQVIELHKNGEFDTYIPNTIYHNIRKEEALWLHFRTDSLIENKNICILNTFLDFSELYILKSDSTIVKKETFSLLEKNKWQKDNRFPNWSLPIKYSNSDIFLKIKDVNNTKTNLNITFLNNNQLKKILLKENNIIIAQAIILALLFTLIFILFIAKKELSLFWYSLYILTFLIEYLTHNGVHLSLGWFNSTMFYATSQMFLPNIGIMFAVLFFINFYPYTAKTNYIKIWFKYILYFFIFSSLLFISFFILDYIYLPIEWIITPTRIIVFIILIIHIILAYKKVIPFYLSFAFALPIITFFLFTYSNHNFYTSINTLLIYDNAVYATTSIEIALIIYYIINKLIKSEFLTINLQNENLILRNTFHENILDIQHQERNKLLNNVHDTFGGYLESLKLRLLLNDKKNKDNKVQEILDSFYNEYRYLLNSLYSPKINSENFKDTLIQFCEKLNNITDINIINNIDLKNIKITANKCIQIYRIISELTTNAIKHSKASNINLKVYQNTYEIIIEVVDDGVGFDIDYIKSSSFGLNSIKERVNLLNGLINIDSQKNLGTSIKITIPKNNE